MKININNLNINQRQAVVSESKYIRIIAGAGSGKTRVLTSRIAYLIEEKHVIPKKILAITFTNKAANEMKIRVSKQLEQDKTGVWISTIHSLCVRILREDIHTMGYPRNFTIIDSNDQKTILKEAYKEIGLDKSTVSFHTMLDYIGNNKGAYITEERAELLAHGDFVEELKAKCYSYYLKRQNQVYGLDFDDLLLWTVKMFKTYSEVRSKWSRRFNYIHVDEFQDIDSVQYQLIKYLGSNDNSIVVVGDPDQTIYTWRGADVNIIMGFEKDYENVETIVLNENYRSSANILKGANSVIKNNKYRIEKELFTNIETDVKIQHYSSASEEYEAAYVANKIQEIKDTGGKYEEVAVLYRSNYLSRSIEKSLLESRIPYIIFGGTRFFDRQEVKDALCYLRMITSADDLALLRVINNPKRGLGNKTLDKVRLLSNELKLTMYETLKAEKITTGKNQRSFDNFVNMIEKWRSLQTNLPIDKLLNKVLDESGYKAMLEEKQETERLENLKELINDIQVFTETYPDSSLDEYLQLVSLYGDREETKSMDCVKLMTIHASKGLEFERVFVVGLSEGIFPSNRSLEAGRKGVEEERRLAYVAFTRAKRYLYLTDSGGFSYVIQGNKIQSRFINEIDEECISHQGVNQQQDNSRGSVYISSNNYHEKKSIKLSEPVQYRVTTENIDSKIKKGDHVMHKMFGQGIVVNIKDKVATIAFNHPYGIKKIKASHPSIQKVGRS
jgi:DNA helicase-2/ATP-dependent DNA helicase PcrA